MRIAQGFIAGFRCAEIREVPSGTIESVRLNQSSLRDFGPVGVKPSDESLGYFRNVPTGHTGISPWKRRANRRRDSDGSIRSTVADATGFAKRVDAWVETHAYLHGIATRYERHGAVADAGRPRSMRSLDAWVALFHAVSCILETGSKKTSRIFKHFAPSGR